MSFVAFELFIAIDTRFISVIANKHLSLVFCLLMKVLEAYPNFHIADFVDLEEHSILGKLQFCIVNIIGIRLNNAGDFIFRQLLVKVLISDEAKNN